jgi:hypothetical protein
VFKSEGLSIRIEDEQRLEAAYWKAAAEHSRAVAKLADARRSLPKAEYLKVRREVEIAWLGVEAARVALESLRTLKKAGGRGN